MQAGPGRHLLRAGTVFVPAHIVEPGCRLGALQAPRHQPVAKGQGVELGAIRRPVRTREVWAHRTGVARRGPGAGSGLRPGQKASMLPGFLHSPGPTCSDLHLRDLQRRQGRQGAG